jgi:hypothetical protein
MNAEPTTSQQQRAKIKQKKKTQRSEMTNNFQKQHRAGNIPIISTKPTN